MIKERLLKYRFFQKLLKLKLSLKNKIRNTDLAKHLSDKNALKSFDKHVNQKEFIYEKEIDLLKHIVKEQDIIFDIGANRGEFTFYFSNLLNQKGKVYAFEPGKRAFNILSKIKKKYKMDNVSIFKLALSNSVGMTKLVVPYYNRQASIKSIESIKGKIENIETSTIDIFSNTNKIDRLDIIKCDTEGSELLIFQGGENTIVKFKPILIIEIADDHTQRFGYSGEKVQSFLTKLGYHTFYYDFNLRKLRKENMISFNTISGEGHVWSRITDNLSNNNYVFVHENKLNSIKYLYNEKATTYHTSRNR